MKSILISHSNETGQIDREISLKLYDYLSERKIDCWIDAKLKAGLWPGQIGKVIAETPIVVLVASRYSLSSDEVMGEVANYVNKEDRLVIPFVLDKAFYLNLRNVARGTSSDALGQAVYHFGGNRHQAVFTENYATLDEAFDRLIQLLPPNVSRLDNNPADFDYADGGDRVLTGYNGKDACVTVPSYVEEIAREAFINNEFLRKVIIPPSVKKIGLRAFFGCVSLSEVEGMQGAEEVDKSAFDDCLIAPCKANGYRCLDVVFGGEKEDVLTVPRGARVIASKAFRYCGAQEVVLPQGLQSIGASAFEEGLFIKEIRIPASVTHLGANAFRGCGRLSRVIFEGDVPADAERAFDNLQQLITEDK